MSVVSQQHDLQVNSDDLHLISRSFSTYKHQDNMISYQICSFDFFSIGSDKRKSEGHL